MTFSTIVTPITYPNLIDHLGESVMLAVTDLLESLLLQKVRFEDPNVDYWGSQDATFVVLDVFSKLVVAETL